MKYLIQGRPHLLIIISFLTPSIAEAQNPDKIMIIRIDGARCSETFGDLSLGLTASGVSCPPMAGFKRIYVNKLIS